MREVAQGNKKPAELAGLWGFLHCRCWLLIDFFYVQLVK